MRLKYQLLMYNIQLKYKQHEQKMNWETLMCNIQLEFVLNCDLLNLITMLR